MIRAVFFGFLETLARPAQSREQIQAEICRQLGYLVIQKFGRRDGSRHQATPLL